MLDVLAQIADVLPGNLPWAQLQRLAIDLVCVATLVRLIYYRRYQRANLFLTFVSMNVTIFLITLLLNQVEMTMGAAFGLFAVFSMLRYRTEGISAKDMTYLFLAIALGLMLAVAPFGWAGLIAIGAVLLLCTELLESSWVVRREHAQPVLFENIKLIQASARPELINDLKSRTGLNVHRVDVDEIDFVKDAARLTVYYYAE